MADCIDPDLDEDGVLNAVDCASADAVIHSGAVEFCNGVDDNCVFGVDEGFVDSDADGLLDCVDPDQDNDGIFNVADCVLLNPVVVSGLFEFCDGIDNNCVDGVDEGCVVDGDVDEDGDPDFSDCVLFDLVVFHG